MYHAADLHLDSPLSGVPDLEPGRAWRNPTRRAFAALIDACNEDAADLLLVAGDLFDREWRDIHGGVWLLRQLDRLETTRTVLIEGNHDAANSLLQSLTWPERVHLLSRDEAESVVFDDLGVAVHGRSFPLRHVCDNIALAFPPPVPGLVNIGLLHTSLNGHARHDPYAPCTPDQLAAHGYDYWALGHVHTRGEPIRERPWIVYPGNIQGRHFRETGPRGCLRFDIEDGRIGAPEFLRLDVVELRDLEIDLTGGPDTFDAVVDAVVPPSPAAGRPLLLRLVLRGETDLHPRLLADPDALLERAQLALGAEADLWLGKLALRTRPPGDADPGPPAGFDALLAEAAESLWDDEAFAADAERLRLHLGRELPDWESRLPGVTRDAPALLRHLLVPPA